MRIPEYLTKEKFGIDAARELCRAPGMFKVETVYKRDVIASKLLDAFIDAGGNKDTSRDTVARVFKAWSQTDRPFERIDGTQGRYRFLGYGEQSSSQAHFTEEEVQGGMPRAEDAFSPEYKCGNGPHEVYAWCLPRYRADQPSRWPIKIGRAGPDGLRRRLRDFWENLPERPCYLIRYGCADEAEARDREQLLHKYFKSRRQKIEDLPGDEWFLTNVDEIIEAIRFIDPLSVSS